MTDISRGGAENAEFFTTEFTENTETKQSQRVNADNALTR